MATDRMALVDVLRKGQDPEVDFLKEGVRWLVQELMEAEVSAQIGADRYARSDERTTQRNGYRTRPWDTRVGTLELAIPKLRSGSYFPSWLDARKRGEQALVAVVAEAYVLRAGRLDVQGRGVGADVGHQWPQQERGQPHGRQPRCPGRGVPHAPAGRRV